MYLHFCLAPGIIDYFKLGRTHRIVSVIRSCLPRIRTGASELELVLETQGLTEAIYMCRKLAEALKATNLVPPEGTLLPMSAVAIEAPTVFRELWNIAPPGALIYPSKHQVPGGEKWFYDFSIIYLVESPWVQRRFFPVRPLMILGPRPKECFFCGSREHPDDSCVDPWGFEERAFTTKRLAHMSPNLWREEIARSGQDSIDLGDRVSQLMSDLRREFQWHYTELIIRTTATRFIEMASSPLRPVDLLDLREVLETGRSRDIKSLTEQIAYHEERMQGSSLFLVKGMNLMMKGDWDGALSAFWQAENVAQTPIRKQYACLLQMRIYFLRNNLDGAAAALSRGISIDSLSPQFIYWQGILNALYGKKQGVVNCMKRLEEHPRWLVATMAEPLMIRFEEQVEQQFLAAWQKAEQAAHWGLQQIDSLLEGLNYAFGPGCSDDLGIEVRDWRGRMANGGYAHLLSAPEFFNAIQKKISSSTASHYHKLMTALYECRKDIQDILPRIPKKRDRYPLRNACLELLGLINEEIRSHRTPKKLNELTDFYKDVQEIQNKTEILIDRCETAIALEWKYTLLKKYTVIGAGLVAAVWLGFYLYSLVFNFLK